MNQLLQKIFRWISGAESNADPAAAGITRSSVFLFFMSGFSVILVFLSNFILIRFAGPDAYGTYVYLFNLVYLLAGFGSLGLDTLLLKKTVIFEEQNRWSELRGLWRFGIITVVLGSLLLTMISRLLVSFSGTDPFTRPADWYLFVFLSLCALSFSLLLRTALQARGRMAWSQAGEKLMRPGLLIIFVMAYQLFWKSPDARALLWINLAGILLTMVTLFMVSSGARPPAAGVGKFLFDTRNWMILAFSFFAVDFLYHFNARINVYLLGIYEPASTVGVYNIALRISEVAGLMLSMVNIVIAPQITRRYADGDMVGLQALISRTARLAFSAGLFILLLVILFRRIILGFFGDAYLDGSTSLVICCAGQLANIFFGSVGVLLVLTGHEKYSIYSLVSGTLLSIGLNLLLTPRFGITGTAMATATGLVCWNLLMYYFVRRKLKIRTTAVGVL